NEDGALVEETQRYPFGLARWSSTNDRERVGFTNKAADPGGLVRIGARLYDPTLGRWASPDPAFVVLDPQNLETPWGALGGYVYGWNAPLDGRDANGEDWSKKEKSVAIDVLQAFGLSLNKPDNARTIEQRVNYMSQGTKILGQKRYGTDNVVDSVSLGL